MHLAFISYEFPPDTGGGGIGTYLRQVAPALAEAGHIVEVFAGGKTSTRCEERPGLVIHRVASASSPSFARDVVPAFAAVHETDPFDVIEGCEFDASALFIKRRYPALPYVCKLHTPRFAVDELHHRPPGWWDRLRISIGALRRGRRPPDLTTSDIRTSEAAQLECAAIAEADALAAPSQAIADAARDWVPGLEVPCAVFPYPYTPPPALLAIPAETATRRVTFLGRVEERKGVLDLADAIPSILARHPDARFRFVGRVMPRAAGDGSTADALLARVGAGAAAVEITGPRPPESIPDLLRDTDLLVVPSHWESFGLVCCEGLAAARGVIGSAAGGMAEIITAGATGLLVPPAQPRAIADAVCRLLENPAERVRLGEAGRRSVLERYALARVLPLQVAHYQSVLARRPSRPHALS